MACTLHSLRSPKRAISTPVFKLLPRVVIPADPQNIQYVHLSITHVTPTNLSCQSIGYLAQFINALEENPHVPQLFRNGTPFLSTMCRAEYSPSFPDHLRSVARKAISDDTALERLKHGLLELSPIISRAMLGTTQAADIIEGGVKVNSLPERAAVIVNHRIAEHRYVHT